MYEQNTIEKLTKKGDLGNTKNYRGITLIAITGKVYNVKRPNRIQPEVKILRKNQNGFRKKKNGQGIFNSIQSTNKEHVTTHTHTHIHTHIYIYVCVCYVYER